MVGTHAEDAILLPCLYCSPILQAPSNSSYHHQQGVGPPDLVLYAEATSSRLTAPSVPSPLVPSRSAVPPKAQVR